MITARASGKKPSTGTDCRISRRGIMKLPTLSLVAARIPIPRPKARHMMYVMPNLRRVRTA